MCFWQTGTLGKTGGGGGYTSSLGVDLTGFDPRLEWERKKKHGGEVSHEDRYHSF